MVDRGPQLVRVARARAAVEAVAGNDEVDVVPQGIDVGLGFELDADAELACPASQDLEQAHPGDRGEAVAVGGNDPASVADIHRTPMAELRFDGSNGVWVGLGNVGQGLVGEHHAEPERVTTTVALVHRDVVVRVLLLHQDAEEQAGRASADARNLHRGNRA